ncbi:MAG: hypothetical protein R2909_07350 [Gemmatimonadales bacterium]
MDSLAALAAERPEALSRLATSLLASTREIRSAAAERLAALGAEGREPLEAMLLAEPADARVAAAYGLGLLGPNARRSLPSLLRVLGEPDDSAAAMANWAIGEIAGDRPGRQIVLLQILRFRPPAEQADAIAAIAALGPGASRFAPSLARILVGEDPALSRLAANVLIQIGPLALPAIEQVAADPAIALRPGVARVLRTLRKTL